jgi:hypothetical protein
VLLCDDVGCSSQVTLSFARADFAAHQLSATIATPPNKPWSCWPPSTTKAFFTPGSFLISSRFDDLTLAANTGAFSNTA